MEDESKWCDNFLGIYGGQDPRPEFGRFLDLAESRKGLLPPWWNKAKRGECESYADGSKDLFHWFDISCAVDSRDIQSHWRDGAMPMKLRLMGEKIYGRGFFEGDVEFGFGVRGGPEYSWRERF